eukprot:jgi/Hompol1/743/HPOL_001355-RA
MTENQTTIEQLNQSHRTLQAALDLKEREMQDTIKELAAARKQNEALIEHHATEKRDLEHRHNTRVDEITRELKALQVAHDAATSDLSLSRTEIFQLKTTIATQSAASIALESSNRALNQTLETLVIG